MAFWHLTQPNCEAGLKGRAFKKRREKSLLVVERLSRLVRCHEGAGLTKGVCLREPGRVDIVRGWGKRGRENTCATLSDLEAAQQVL